MLDVRPLRLEGLVELRPGKHNDERGFFSEVWSHAAMADAGFNIDFVQDNHSYSAAKGVLRGLHFQLPPGAQDKLIRVARGSVFDVAVDLRRGSPTYGDWDGIILSAELWNQLLVPCGFAHGFLTLTEHTEVLYKVSSPFRADLDRSVRFDDPAIGIDWPDIGTSVTLSARDRNAPLLADIDAGFD